MARTGKTPSELLEQLYALVGPHHYDRRDIIFDEAARKEIVGRMNTASPGSVSGIKVLKKEITDGFRFILQDGSWLLVRFSGTEPLLRIYAESNNLDNVRRLLDDGLKMAGVKDAS